jgi:hypothetical protein
MSLIAQVYAIMEQTAYDRLQYVPHYKEPIAIFRFQYGAILKVSLINNLIRMNAMSHVWQRRGFDFRLFDDERST